MPSPKAKYATKYSVRVLNCSSSFSSAAARQWHGIRGELQPSLPLAHQWTGGGHLRPHGSAIRQPHLSSNLKPLSNFWLARERQGHLPNLTTTLQPRCPSCVEGTAQLKPGSAPVPEGQMGTAGGWGTGVVHDTGALHTGGQGH